MTQPIQPTDERAAVVAWLRKHADTIAPYNLAVALHHAADCIERSDHLAVRQPTTPEHDR